EIELGERCDRLGDNRLGRACQMEATKHAVEWDVGEPRPGMRKNVDEAGVRAGGKYDLPLAGQVHRHETFVPHYLVRLPIARFAQPKLTRKSLLEGGSRAESRRSHRPSRRGSAARLA